MKRPRICIHQWVTGAIPYGSSEYPVDEDCEKCRDDGSCCNKPHECTFNCQYKAGRSLTYCSCFPISDLEAGCYDAHVQETDRRLKRRKK